MDEIFKPFLSDTAPSPPKFNVDVTRGALAPMDERNQTLNITFTNTRAETLRFGGAGVQHSVRGWVWIFCPSTVSPSDVSTSFGIQISTWKHPSAWCWSFFQTAHNIAFSRVNATCLSPVLFFLLLDAQLIAKCAKHYLFTSKCHLCPTVQDITLSHVLQPASLPSNFLSFPGNS